MNTKHTRIVITLALAVAALATMGFRASTHLRSPSVNADFGTCSPDVTFTMADLLDDSDEPCASALLYEIETEMGSRGVYVDAWPGDPLTGSGITQVGPASIYAAPAGSLLEPDIDYHNPSSLWWDAGESSLKSSSAADDKSWTQEFLDYHDPSSLWSDVDESHRQSGSAADAKSWAREFLDYHDPSSPWADAE